MCSSTNLITRAIAGRILGYCAALVFFLRPLETSIQMNTQQQHPYTVMIPISKGCNVSSDAVAARNVTAYVGSRLKGMSLLASEIKSISHIPSKRQIVITYRGILCDKPYVIGRLSGPAVSFINKWTPVSIDDASFNENAKVEKQLVGEYNVPSKGIYFLEIMGLLCKELVWDDEYKDICLEDPSYMQLTDDSVNIYVDTLNADDDAVGNEGGIGHWKWSSNDSPMPLRTRYQPEGCRKNELDETCFLLTSRDRFFNYQFHFHTSNEEFSVQERVLAANTSHETTRLCFVGLSHAREMASAVKIWLSDWTAHNIKATNVDAQFPRMVNEQFVQQRIIGQCTKTVIAAGQWSVGMKPPASKYANLPPTPFPKYRDEVIDMILALKAAGAEGVFLRSIHYNSLGDVKLTCPPQDWRHPAVIDQLNSILVNLTQTMGVKFIDTSDIIGPMWDSAEDFCHYRNDKVSSAEALYMLGRLF